MSADDLRTLIRSDVLADEPPFAMSGDGWRTQGARAVRRRRTRRVTAAVAGLTALATAAVLVVPHLAADDTDSSRIPPAAQRVLDRFDPETFPQELDAEIRSVLGDAVPASVAGRVEPTLDGWTRLRPEDYAYTDAWTATYDVSPTDRVVVMLRHDQSANEGSARRYCDENLADATFERCTAGALHDGSIAISSVMKLRRTPRGWTSVRPADGPESWWFARVVVNRRDYGFGVIAREYVKATSLAEADRRWSVSEALLTTLSANPSLVYQLPDEDDRECDSPTYLTPQTEDGFARVVCDGR
jgi:hypothetical protein